MRLLPDHTPVELPTIELPVSVDVGDAVAAGSVNGSGTLRVTASAPGTNNSLTQIVRLVAASPCAMAISVPVTVISAIGSASKLGIAIKSGQAFEQLGTITRVAFDKTGTLTPR